MMLTRNLFMAERCACSEGFYQLPGSSLEAAKKISRKARYRGASPITALLPKAVLGIAKPKPLGGIL